MDTGAGFVVWGCMEALTLSHDTRATTLKRPYALPQDIRAVRRVQVKRQVYACLQARRSSHWPLGEQLTGKGQRGLEPRSTTMDRSCYCAHIWFTFFEVGGICSCFAMERSLHRQQGNIRRVLCQEDGSRLDIVGFCRIFSSQEPYAVIRQSDVITLETNREVVAVDDLGDGALVTCADGSTYECDACDMEPGDLVLTPIWSWHDHNNQSDEPMVWFDGLDPPLLTTLESIFFENPRKRDDKL